MIFLFALITMFPSDDAAVMKMTHDGVCVLCAGIDSVSGES
jgi:hypothetical protein